jgi:hypothetical protein
MPIYFWLMSSYIWHKGLYYITLWTIWRFFISTAWAIQTQIDKATISHPGGMLTIWRFLISTAWTIQSQIDKHSMILRYVHYGDFNKDYMILPGVRYNYFAEDRIAILDHLIIRWDHTQRYKQGYNRCNYVIFKIFVFVFYLSPMMQ